MDSKFLTILFFLILICCLLVALLGTFFYFIFNKKNKTLDESTDSHKVASEPVPVTKVFEESHVENCSVHTEILAQAFCSICKVPICENCIREDANIYFCAEHFKLYLNSEWIELESIITTPNNPEDGMYIYDFQESIWKRNNIPSFIVTHYKIDLDLDHIESHVKIMARKKDQDLLKVKLSQIK